MTPPATQSAAQNVSAEQFRAQFPALEHTAYFASCSQGALSGTLASALTEFQAPACSTAATRGLAGSNASSRLAVRSPP